MEPQPLSCRCGQEWIQPARTGRCPRCHSDEVDNVDERINGLDRR